MKTYLIKAKLSEAKKIYREIEILESSTLYSLAEVILQSFDFQFDHLFGFGDNFDSYWNSETTYELSPEEKGVGNVKKTKLNQVSFFKNPKDKMSFLFDFGDDWQFELELVDFGEQIKGEKYPRILKSVGEAPSQY